MDDAQQLIISELKEKFRMSMDILRKKEEERLIAVSKLADAIEKLEEKEREDKE